MIMLTGGSYDFDNPIDCSLGYRVETCTVHDKKESLGEQCAYRGGRNDRER